MMQRISRLAVALAAAGLLGACAPVLIGGAVAGGTMVATDRRTSGTQVDDQSIELKAINSVSALLGDRAHVNVTSYNRLVLLTGEVPTAADKAAVEKAIAQIANVRSIVNELAAMPNSNFSARSNDTLITGKVKAAFVDTSDLQVNSIKVVTERSVVYLMGRVTEREATRAAEVARSVGGVQKVVRVFEIITPAELAAVQAASAPPAPASAASAAKP
jgi:osmotically-inducible protein OsmY